MIIRHIEDEDEDRIYFTYLGYKGYLHKKLLEPGKEKTVVNLLKHHMKIVKKERKRNRGG